MNKETIKALKRLMIYAAVLVLIILHLDKVFLTIGVVIGILRPFIIGAATAFVINIPMRAIECKVFCKKNKASKWKRPLSLVMAVLAISLVLWAVYMLIIPQLGKAVSELAVKIPVFLADTVKVLQEVFDNNPQIMEYIAGLDISTWDWNSIFSKVANTLGNGIGNVLMSTVSVAGSIFGVVFDTVIALVFAVYLLIQKDTLADHGERVMRAYLPEKIHYRILYILKLLHKNFSNFISSQCLEALILGTLFIIAMSIFGFPYAVLVGTLIAVTALVPIVGGFVGCAVGAFLILVENPLLVIWFIVMFLIIQQLEGNLIYPRVVGSSVGLPAVWVLVAVSVGGSLFGVVGMLIFIPITSTLYTLLREDVNERNTKKARLTAKADTEDETE